MINLITMATRPKALSDKLGITCKCKFKPVYQARPGMYLPMIINQDGRPVLEIGTWGCSLPQLHMPMSTFPTEKILTQAPLNRWIHTQRCLVPANCFFARISGEANPVLVRLLQSRLFLIGGLYQALRTPENKTAYSFLLLSTESADVLRPLMTEMPLIMTTEHFQDWLNGEHLVDLMQIADSAGDQWFDYFPVSREILQPGINKRELLKPLGMSKFEQSERELKLKAIDIRQDRFNRKGSKR